MVPKPCPRLRRELGFHTPTPLRVRSPVPFPCGCCCGKLGGAGWGDRTSVRTRPRRGGQRINICPEPSLTHTDPLASHMNSTLGGERRLEKGWWGHVQPLRPRLTLLIFPILGFSASAGLGGLSDGVTQTFTPKEPEPLLERSGYPCPLSGWLLRETDPGLFGGRTKETLLYTNTGNCRIVKSLPRGPASPVISGLWLRTGSDLGTGKETVTFHWGR